MDGKQARVDTGYFALLIILLTIGLWILVSSIPVGFGSMSEVGAGAFPALMGCIIVILQVVNIKRARSLHETVPKDTLFVRHEMNRIVAIMLTAVLWIIILPYLGYVLDTLVITLIQKKVFGTNGWVEPLVQSLATSVFVFLLFDVLFYIDLPRGFLY